LSTACGKKNFVAARYDTARLRQRKIILNVITSVCDINLKVLDTKKFYNSC